MKYLLTFIITVPLLASVVLGIRSSNNKGNFTGYDTKLTGDIGKNRKYNSGENDSWWWPKQPLPEGIVKCRFANEHDTQALAHSIAGLVAQANKERVLDELVWLETNSEIYDRWYKKFISRTKLQERGTFNVMELLQRYKDKGIIEGYILYNPETNREFRNGMDFSYNIAASYAGVKKAIIISVKMESAIIELGFKKILDARSVSRQECFDDLKDQCTRDFVVTMNPALHNNIDFAIANKAMVTYGTDIVTESIMERAKSGTPVVGWNTGGESVFTGLPTKYGMFNTASNYCNNLIVLSSNAESADFEKVKTLDPKTINFESGKHFHSFIMSDGDNMQWTMGSFINNADYWGSPFHGKFPIGFTSCPLNLSMVAPDVLDELSLTQPQHTTVIEYGGGYQYPDQFASKRDNREDKLQDFAKAIDRHMNRTGTRVFGFIVMDIDSEEAMKAYRIYAKEIKNLIGMFAVQYAPYHGGNGKVFWVENEEGIEIPVVTAKYSLWKDLRFKGGGNIDTITHYINNDVENKAQSMNWTSVHAWSEFENPHNCNEEARGMTPISWTIDGLNKEVRVVSPEELLWRIRMEHNPGETRKIIRQY